MDGSLGAVLKKLRKKKKLTAKETADKLSSLGYEISEKTISGYETGIRMPNADVFMALCTIYDCKNILEMFSFIKADYSIPTDTEWEMVEKYRFISTHSPNGASVVDTVLNREYTIAEKLKEKEENVKKDKATSEIIPMRVMSYYQRMASAGSGEYLFDDIPTDLIEVEDTDIARKADFVLGVNGCSMEPTYNNGDKVLVQKTRDISIGDIGVFLREGECFIKEASKDRLISHNKDKDLYPDILIDERRIDTVGKVLGKAEI